MHITDKSYKWLASAIAEQAVADLTSHIRGIRDDAAAWIHSPDFGLFLSLSGMDHTAESCRFSLRRRGMLPADVPPVQSGFHGSVGMKRIAVFHSLRITPPSHEVHARRPVAGSVARSAEGGDDREGLARIAPPMASPGDDRATSPGDQEDLIHPVPPHVPAGYAAGGSPGPDPAAPGEEAPSLADCADPARPDQGAVPSKTPKHIPAAQAPVGVMRLANGTEVISL